MSRKLAGDIIKEILRVLEAHGFTTEGRLSYRLVGGLSQVIGFDLDNGKIYIYFGVSIGELDYRHIKDLNLPYSMQLYFRLNESDIGLLFRTLTDIGGTKPGDYDLIIERGIDQFVSVTLPKYSSIAAIGNYVRGLGWRGLVHRSLQEQFGVFLP